MTLYVHDYYFPLPDTPYRFNIPHSRVRGLRGKTFRMNTPLKCGIFNCFIMSINWKFVSGLLGKLNLRLIHFIISKLSSYNLLLQKRTEPGLIFNALAHLYIEEYVLISPVSKSLTSTFLVLSLNHFRNLGPCHFHSHPLVEALQILT